MALLVGLAAERLVDEYTKSLTGPDHPLGPMIKGSSTKASKVRAQQTSPCRKRDCTETRSHVFYSVKSQGFEGVS
jgi:hypothetical protein